MYVYQPIQFLKFIARSGTLLMIQLVVLFCTSCQRDISELDPAEYPAYPNVFINSFSPGLNYAAFGGSVPTAFQVDTEVGRNNLSEASMRFEVPDVNDPRGAYAGGAFFTSTPRNLSGFDALTFWIRATKAADIDVIGFGNDLGESRFQATIFGLPVNTNWQKVIIPIPDPSKLTAERGMLFYSEGPEEGRGYTFWIDEVKFEKLGTLANPRALMLLGEDRTVSPEPAEIITIDGLQAVYNLPTGIDMAVTAAPAYFEFESSNPDVATILSGGRVRVESTGSATITARMGNREARGSLTVNSSGQVERPLTRAPVPTRAESDVISLYTNVYPNRPVDTWNTRWQFSNAEEFFIQIEGDDVIRYRNLNFVGIEFASSTINATNMTHIHMNIWTPDNTNPPRNFKVLLVDFGPNNVFGGGDDTSHEIIITRPTLVTGQWVTIEIPLASFTGLTRRGNLAQMVLSGDLPNLYLSNVYFYRSGSGGMNSPIVAAPSPTVPAGNVISIFSDVYTNRPGTDFNPNWGQATQVSQIQIQGNNTLRYGGLNYQGTQLAQNVDVSQMNFLHLDYWTSNSTELRVFLISPGPVETPFILTVPSSGWNSIDIPLSAFAPVDLRNIFQFKFEGNGNIYLDNIYFRR
jgi:hypothetical protein